MTLSNVQSEIDKWIKEVGGGYFDIKTNTIVLMEEVGELSSVIARKYGAQVPKEGDSMDLKNELGDVLWVLICIANQLDIDIEEVIKGNIAKKYKRDKERFK